MSFDDDEPGPPDELVKIYDSIETFFLPATNSPSPNKALKSRGYR